MSERLMPVLTDLQTVASRSVLPANWRADWGEPAACDLQLPVLELLRRATSRLSEDVIQALVAGRDREEADGRAANTIATMLENVVLADAHGAPMCQDTGTLIFWVKHPFGFSQRRLAVQIRAAVVEATQRPGCVPTAWRPFPARIPGTIWIPFMRPIL